MGKVDEMLGLDGETKMNIGLLKPIELCLVVNGLGGTSNLELGLLAHLAMQSLEKRGGKVCTITHAMCGNFMTSLNMRGASLTVSVLDENDGALLDAPCEVNAWPRCINLSSTTNTSILQEQPQTDVVSTVLPDDPAKDETTKEEEEEEHRKQEEEQTTSKSKRNQKNASLRSPKAVSYTHLTLPTILLV